MLIGTKLKDNNIDNNNIDNDSSSSSRSVIMGKVASLALLPRNPIQSRAIGRDSSATDRGTRSFSVFGPG